MSDVDLWKRTASGNSTAAPDGFPEGMPRSGVNDSSREVMAAVKRFYDAPDFRNPFRSFTITRTTGTSWILVDGGGQTNASQFLEVGQRIKMVISTNPTVDFWEGWVETIAAYANPNSAFTVSWIAGDSKDTAGPTTATNVVITVGPKELGRAAWLDTGTGAGQIPTADQIKSYAYTKDENTLDVGFVSGITASDLMEAAARGRLNANGSFSIWQRGTSFTNATPFLNNADQVIADNWVLLSDGNNRVNIARDTDVPVGVPVQYSMRMTLNSVNKHAVMTFCEFNDSADVGRPTSGNRVSVSFWIRRGATVGIDTIRVYVVNLKNQFPSTSPINVWTTGAIGFNSTDWEPISAATTAVNLNSVGGTWTEFKIQNIDMNGLGVGPIGICFVADDDGAGFANPADWMLTAVQANRGAVALPFMSESISMEYLRCARYAESTFDWFGGVTPSAAQGTSHALISRSGGTSPIAFANWQFRVPKYKAPTLVTYNPRVAGAQWSDMTASDVAVASSTVTRAQANIISGAVTANTTYYIGAFAHANIWGNS